MNSYKSDLFNGNEKINACRWLANGIRAAPDLEMEDVNEYCIKPIVSTIKDLISDVEYFYSTSKQDWKKQYICLCTEVLKTLKMHYDKFASTMTIFHKICLGGPIFFLEARVIHFIKNWPFLKRFKKKIIHIFFIPPN